MVAKGVRALLHLVIAPPQRVAAAPAPAARPPPAEVLDPAAARAALWRDEAAARRAGVRVVDRVGVVEAGLAARDGLLGVRVARRVGAELVLHHVLDLAAAGRHVVMVEVVVDAHLCPLW